MFYGKGSHDLNQENNAQKAYLIQTDRPLFRERKRFVWLTRSLAVIGAVVLCLFLIVGYRMVHHRLVGDIYRQRLVQASQELEQVREKYNRAVRKSAVTELLVDESQVTVLLKTPDGVIKQVETSVDPQQEVYVDYVVRDGRLWIRRVFDGRTPPSNGTVIDPALIDLDWDAAGMAHGQAVYRQLTPGRWVITVTGGGAIGLRKAEGDEEFDLQASPLIEPFEPLPEKAREDVEAISPSDVVGNLFSKPREATASE